MTFLDERDLIMFHMQIFSRVKSTIICLKYEIKIYLFSLYCKTFVAKVGTILICVVNSSEHPFWLLDFFLKKLNK